MDFCLSAIMGYDVWACGNPAKIPHTLHNQILIRLCRTALQRHGHRLQFQHSNLLLKLYCPLRRASPVEAAVLEFCIYPFGIAAGVKKITIDKDAVDEEAILYHQRRLG